MEIKQIWEVKYKVSPTLSKSEEFAGYSFEVSNGDTYVTKIYSKNVTLEEKRIKSKLVKKVFPHNETIDDQKAIRNILLKRMIYTGSFSEITVEPQFYLKNQQDLENEGFTLTKDIRNSVDIVWDILDVGNDYLSTCEQFWKNGFKGMFSESDEEIFFISDWIEKSVVEKQPEQSFMLLWVAFNCIYETFYEKSEIKCTKRNGPIAIEKIEIAIKNLLKDADITKIIDGHSHEINTLVSYNLLIINFDDSPFNQLLNILRCLYKIRNNLFHEGSLIQSIGPWTSVGKNLLLTITTKMLRNMVNT
ncbi:MAG: hypothetical protein KJ630_05610 [Proteobacteria bacterium]|nr:hypothetical protein [Pseudomonadota bacterium]